MKNGGESKILLTYWGWDGVEIILCGWNNSRSAIRETTGEEELAAVSTPNYCSSSNYKGFWISVSNLDYSQIKVEIGQRGKRTSFLSAVASYVYVKYVGFSSCCSYGTIKYPKPSGRDLKCFFFSKLSFSYTVVKSSKDVLGCAFQCQKRNMEKNGACNSFHVTKVNCMNLSAEE